MVAINIHYLARYFLCKDVCVFLNGSGGNVEEHVVCSLLFQPIEVHDIWKALCGAPLVKCHMFRGPTVF